MASEPIFVVSGLPRSGTSLMMQMLAAAGIEPLTDQQRTADEDNPEGYFEFEAVKRTRQDASWVSAAPGKAVKVIHALLPDLPTGFPYRIILMDRDLNEVLRSQAKMLQRSGRTPPAISDEALKRVYTGQLEGAIRWASTAPSAQLLRIGYADLIARPLEQAQSVAEFIGKPGKGEAMAAAVRPDLYRNRTER